MIPGVISFCALTGTEGHKLTKTSPIAFIPFLLPALQTPTTFHVLQSFNTSNLAALETVDCVRRAGYYFYSRSRKKDP